MDCSLSLQQCCNFWVASQIYKCYKGIGWRIAWYITMAGFLPLSYLTRILWIIRMCYLYVLQSRIYVFVYLYLFIAIALGVVTTRNTNVCVQEQRYTSNDTYYSTGVQIVGCTLSDDSVLSESTGLINPVLCVSRWNLFWPKNQPIRPGLSNQVRPGRVLMIPLSTWWLQQAF